MFERARTRIDATTTTVAMAAAAAAVLAYLSATGATTGLDAGTVRATAAESIGLREATLLCLAVGAAVGAKWTVDVLRDLLDAAVKTAAVCGLALVVLHVATGFDAVAFLDAHASQVWATLEGWRGALDLSI